MTNANAHALFNGLKSKPSFLAAITVQKEDRDALMAARAIIRQTLKAAFAQLTNQEEYWEDTYRVKVKKADRPTVMVKFMTQGSFAYNTLNRPAFPQQEIDLDDGMYVPVDFLQNGKPALVAKSLFQFVESALEGVCKKHGWKRREKDTCVRVIISSGAHIDIPIYSIPGEQFKQLIEKVAADSASTRYVTSSAMPRIPTDKVMLALRNGEWTESDPKKLHDWVDNRVEAYGEIYRRLCRFFKGWRDNTWIKSELSSICLMHAIDIALDSLPTAPIEDRDDEMILEVAKFLPGVFQQQVCNPVLPSSCLNTWTPEQRANIVDEAQNLANRMIAALEKSHSANAVIAQLVGGFGVRIPDAPDAIKFSESRISSIQVMKPAEVAAPKISPTISG